MRRHFAIAAMLLAVAVVSAFAQTAPQPMTATVGEVKNWLAQGGDPNADSPVFVTWFTLFALQNPNSEVISALIQGGADVNKVDEYSGATPLMNAAGGNPAPAVIDVLLDAGANAALRDKKGRTAYVYAQSNKALAGTSQLGRLAEAAAAAAPAAQKAAAASPPAAAAKPAKSFRELVAGGTAQEVHEAIEKGANVNEKWGSFTPVVVAASDNAHADVITTLLAAGADPNEGKNFIGEGLLHIAATNISDVDVIQAIIKAGADVNGRDSGGRTPLFNAAYGNRNPAVLDALLAAGADASVKVGDNSAFTASWRNRAIVVGSDLYLKLASASGMTSLPALIHAGAPFSVLSYSISHGADVNAADAQGMTPLMMRNSDELFSALLRAGARVNAQDLNGMTPLMWAIESEYGPGRVDKLLKSGASVAARNSGGVTPLMLACKDDGYDTEVVSLLLTAGAEPADADNEGTTPLMYAVVVDEIKLDNGDSAGKAAMLIEAGANVNARDSKGRTALMLVAYCSMTDPPRLESMLLNAGADGKAKDNTGLTAADWRSKHHEDLKKRAGGK